MLIFFFCMIRRPPRSTLFPTRRSSDLQDVDQRLDVVDDAWLVEQSALCGKRRLVAWLAAIALNRIEQRSEEHTSELQSLTNLVCRLLLEKKKQEVKETTITSTDEVTRA